LRKKGYTFEINIKYGKIDKTRVVKRNVERADENICSKNGDAFWVVIEPKGVEWKATGGFVVEVILVGFV